MIVSPGVTLREPVLVEAQARGVEVVGDIEVFARHARAPVVAVTGTNGKSTVTSLVREMAQAAGLAVRAGGNLGPPALDLLNDGEPDLYVLELSSFQLETTASLKPTVAVVLNITPDHSDRYATLDAYAKAKRRVYRGAGTRVINRDDPLVAAMTEPDGAVVGFTVRAPEPRCFGLIPGEGGACLAYEDDGSCRGQSPNPGPAQRRQCLAASPSARPWACLGGDGQSAPSFHGLPRRCQWIRRASGSIRTTTPKAPTSALPAPRSRASPPNIR